MWEYFRGECSDDVPGTTGYITVRFSRMDDIE